MIYTVILNSALRDPSSTVANAIYNFDWSNALPEGQYVLTWGFCSTNVSVTTADTILLSADLGQSNVFLCNNLTSKAQSSLIIGSALANEVGGPSFYYGDKNTNGPIFLNNRPQNNQFNVRLLTTASVPVGWTDSVGAQMGNYILNLSFDKV